MCMGKTHCAVGAVTGLAYGEFGAHLPLPQTAMLTVFTAGLAVLPDIDHPEATMAQSFGFLTKSFATVVGKVSGGHRWGTHCIIGSAILTGLAMAAVHWRHTLAGRIGLGFLLALTFAAVFCATGAGRLSIKAARKWLHLGRFLKVKHVMELAAIGLALLVSFTGLGLGLLWLATLLGCTAHCIADWPTDQGYPFFYPLSKHRYKLPEPLAFTVNTKPETVLYAVSLAAVAILAILAIDPALGGTAWHAAAHLIRRHS